MKERPILFKPDMVRAILEGRKTMTRRAIKIPKQSFWHKVIGSVFQYCIAKDHNAYWEYEINCPYGKVGDKLWVREAWTTRKGLDGIKPSKISPNQKIGYIANENEAPWEGKIRPSIFMPRWASRILLEVTGVRVERLQDISEEDAVCEGCEPEVYAECCGNGYQDAAHGDLECCQNPIPIEDFKAGFMHLWDSINGKDDKTSWQANPWVWCVEFKQVEIR